MTLDLTARWTHSDTQNDGMQCGVARMSFFIGSLPRSCIQNLTALNSSLLQAGVVVLKIGSKMIQEKIETLQKLRDMSDMLAIAASIAGSIGGISGARRGCLDGLPRWLCAWAYAAEVNQVSLAPAELFAAWQF